MCGIAGTLSSRGGHGERVQAMTRAIAHRGPDDSGIWTDDIAGVSLGHRRLSIVDLSPSGHQPMLSDSGRFVIDFNGEIYNHADLRRALEGQGRAPAGGWRGHSDTETFLECIAGWGLEQALRQAAGMFALALWDKQERRLCLVRDRFGEKPLYYGWIGRDFVFASELKAIRSHPDFAAPIDREALARFAARTYIPAPLTIYQGLFKLEPGCILTLTPDSVPLSRPPREGLYLGVGLTRYWDYRAVVRQGLADPINDEGEALAELERVLGTVISDQAMADVPVGAFLSGGIDSSTITALYQKYSKVPVRTFSIGFEEGGYNEAEYAKQVALHLGTVHDEHYVSVAEARDVIPLLPAMYDEPFADSSQIPTFLVSRFARQQVTVALTGDGGDELFGGYNRHFVAPRLWNRLKHVPAPLRAAGGALLGRVPASLWGTASALLPGSRAPHFGGKIQKALRVAGSARQFSDIYESFIDEWNQEGSPVLQSTGGGGSLDLDVGQGADDAVRMMYCDAVSYLPDDILAKVDRASMAVSLETRVPFLDHRVADVAARIPVAMKIGGGTGKNILRKLLYAEAPRELFERPKSGFAVPVGQWIKGPLRPWAEELLDERRLREDGHFDGAKVRRRWGDHLSGRRDGTLAIWAVLMFQAWRAEA
jgi:asparagine synthase (glutamine-hydrolysing)